MHPWEIGRYAPADLRDALEAFREERSQDREWQAALVATIINTCKSGKLKKRMEAADLMTKEDRVRSAKRYRAAMEAERKRIDADQTSPVSASSDWGPI